ncbi:MAG TPA: cyclically-permuted mutarotase family protein [Prevotella sp.]
MKRIFVVSLVLLGLCCVSAAGHSVSLQLMRGFPHTEKGYAQGVSACFAGAVGHRLVMAGGCNFPDVPAKEGGKKRFYKGIYMAVEKQPDSLQWRRIGQLPVEAAYGVSVQWKNRLIFIGGCNSGGSLQSVWQVAVRNNKAVVTECPSLPCPLDNMAGCLVGHYIYVAGGNSTRNVVFRLNLKAVRRGWETLSPYPGAQRMQPVAGAWGTKGFALWGGFAPRTPEKQASLSMDGLAWNSDKQAWSRPTGPCDENGNEIFLGGAGAVQLANGRLVVAGGVNKTIFLQALNAPQPDYMGHEPAWYRFNSRILLHDGQAWRVLTDCADAARAGCSLVRMGHTIYIIGGELKPGVRTPTVLKMRMHAGKTGVNN